MDGMFQSSNTPECSSRQAHKNSLERTLLRKEASVVVSALSSSICAFPTKILLYLQVFAPRTWLRITVWFGIITCGLFYSGCAIIAGVLCVACPGGSWLQVRVFSRCQQGCNSVMSVPYLPPIFREIDHTSRGSPFSSTRGFFARFALPPMYGNESGSEDQPSVFPQDRVMNKSGQDLYHPRVNLMTFHLKNVLRRQMGFSS